MGSINMAQYYEYENIQNTLNRMSETELQSDRAHELMDRAQEIRAGWGGAGQVPSKSQ